MKSKTQSVWAKSKPESTMGRKFTGVKNIQIEESIKFCLDHNVQGYKALKTGLYPLVKDKEIINRRLDRKIKNGQECHYCTIFMLEEEESVVNHVKNRNRSLEGTNKAELTKLLLDILKIKNYMNRRCKRGWKFVKLSPNAYKD
nr:uncharacterized protein LOC124817938 [Hydra vulgaris]